MYEIPETWIPFASEAEMHSKCVKWGLTTARPKWKRTYYYCYSDVDCPKKCDVVGYYIVQSQRHPLDNYEIAILKIVETQDLIPIHPDFFAQMQPGQTIPEEYVVFDLETTGFSSKDEILEIAAIKYKDGIAIDTYQTLINPDCEIQVAASRVNHITNEIVKDAPNVCDALPSFLNFIGKLPLVSHNAPFDLRYLKKASAKINKEVKNHTFDTVKLSKKAFPELPNHKLQTLVKHFNIEITNAHRALPDAETAACIFQKCFDTLYPIKIISGH